MKVLISEGGLEIRLSLWQKVLGLMRNIRLRHDEVADVEVVKEPMHEAMRSGMKVGLRLPWLYYVARTIRLDQFFLVRRGVPALAFRVENGSPLKRVVISTPEAAALAEQLRRH